MPCDMQTVQRARVTLGRLAEILTPEQAATILNAWAKERLGERLTVATGATFSANRGAWLTIDGLTYIVKDGQVTAEGPYYSRAQIDRFAGSLAEALNEAGRQALAGRIAVALGPFGRLTSDDVQVDDEGVTRRATVLRLTVGG